MSVLSTEVPKIIRYVDTLDAAWMEHCRERAADAPTVISLFAGCGGSSLGYSMAGYRELLAVEMDDHAVETFSKNFPDVGLWHGDVTKLSGDEVLKRTGLRPGELVVLDGSPPCQGFSTMGARKMSDPRNQLFREYVRLLRELRPHALVMENVAGLVKGKMRLIFAEIMRELQESGYRVRARLLDAQWYGVPQMRKRLIFVGVREDLKLAPSHPVPTITRPVTLGTALWRVVNSPEDLSGAAYKYGGGTKCGSLLALMKPGEQGEKYAGRNRFFGLRRLTWDRPSRTILKTDGQALSICCHPTAPRRLTIAELKRVASFPDQFTLTGSFAKQWARIGNSVPPLLMRAIALHVRKILTSTTQEDSAELCADVNHGQHI